MSVYNFCITDVSYDDDVEYRKTICNLFFMEYEDDMDIDNDKFVSVLDWIWAETKNHPLFQVVYIKAASFMLSENQEIGLSILLSYDNLPLFHRMLSAFHTHGNYFDEKDPSYTNLYNKLFS